MYGYVSVNNRELKVCESDEYKSWYCGLCSSLKKNYGRSGQLTINTDMTFLIYLLSGLYSSRNEHFQGRCIVHPFSKRDFFKNKFSDYAADMNILLAWYKLIDDWKDEKSPKARVMLSGLKHGYKKVLKKYPDKCRKISYYFKRLSDLENKNSQNIDELAGCFGSVMAEVCDIYSDEWSTHLKSVGFYLGKFVYIMDAYDDLNEDIKKGGFNCLKAHLNRFDSFEKFDTFIYDVLNVIMASCARSFEMLPIIKNAEVMRNIIYAGVWLRWEELHKKACNVKKAE